MASFRLDFTNADVELTSRGCRLSLRSVSGDLQGLESLPARTPVCYVKARHTDKKDDWQDKQTYLFFEINLISLISIFDGVTI
ncbi:MAG: hypothetical protein P8M80_09910 [Pirellulaceae bacterium]|nr:hypothetical protein [Pirellulaceae bacterium]